VKEPRVDIPEDRFYNPAKINAWFAVSAILVLATTVAAVLADHYDRDWKNYQQAFHEMERKRAEEAIALENSSPEKASPEVRAVMARLLGVAEGALKSPSNLSGEAFKAALEAAKPDPAFPAAAVLAARAYADEAGAMETKEVTRQVEEIEVVLDKAEENRFKTEKDQRELQALVDQHKFSMDHARSQGHAVEAEHAEKEWKETVARERETHARMDAYALEKSAQIEKKKKLMAPISERRERARTLQEAAGVAGASRKIASFVAGGLRDAPLIDQFAPLTKIEQMVFPDLLVDYNFAKIPRVDRCMTCHSGIDKVRVDPVTGAVTPVFTAENTPEKVFRTHPRPELFVSSVSKHSIGKMGCTVCHDGLGWGLTFTDAYHMPSTPAQEKEWKEKYHWHQGESWSEPMLPQKYIEAACFKCHKDQPQLNPEDKFAKEIPSAPQWNRGLALVERHGCFGCHKIDGLAVEGLDKWIGEIQDEDRRGYAKAISIRKTGPSLRRVASKWTSKEAAWNWIWHPQALRPTTQMPRFFGQPNNSGVDDLTKTDYDLRTKTEVWGLVELLWSLSEPFEKKEPPVAGDAARGKLLFGNSQQYMYGSGEAEDEGPGTVGCVACHMTKDFPKDGVKRNDFGPDLSTVGSKTTLAWLYTWLKDPYHYWEGTRMPSLRLSDQEAADIAAYLASLRSPEWEKDVPVPASEAAVRDLAVEAVRATSKSAESPESIVEKMSFQERLRTVGERAATRYACFACHDIKGRENAERIGTELGGGEGWGSKDVDRLDFGLMQDPRAVETYRSWNTDVIPERPGGGRFLPKRKPEWAWLKLKNPRVFDAGVTKLPHEKLVMPNFFLADDEADALVTFLLSLQRVDIPASRRRIHDSREILAEKKTWIARQYNCYGCHTVTRTERVDASGKHVPVPKGGDIRPWLGDERANWPPSLGGEGTMGEGARVQPSWLFSFLRHPEAPDGGNRNMLRFWMSTRMPTFGLTQQELNGLVQGFAAQDAVPFPFEMKQEDELGADAADAKEAFDFLSCASCHPTKAMLDAGKTPSGFAPDLGFARARLRYQWVKQWLDDPKRILPGTGMPANWRPGEGLSVPDGLRFDAERKPRLGPDGKPKVYFGDDPHEQMRRIADYVFSLGKAPAK
jgi:mono/diheme cytochrome c family protein